MKDSKKNIDATKKEKSASSIEHLDLLRVFAISIVVLRHCFSPYTGAWPISEFYNYSNFLDISGRYISSISMPLFVFISGLLFSYLRNNLKKYPTYKTLIKKKYNRLIKPYIIFAPIYIYFILGLTNIKDFVPEFFGGATGHLWFLTMIFAVFLFFYPFEAFFKKRPLLGFFLVSFLFLLFPIFAKFNLIPISKALQYGVFFYVGYFFHTNNAIIYKKLEGKFIWFFLCHLVLFSFVPKLLNNIDSLLIANLIAGYMKLPLGLLSIIFTYLAFSKLGKVDFYKYPPLISSINNSSYYIYLIHQPVLMLLFKWQALTSLNGIYVVIFAFIFSFTISFVLGHFFMASSFGRKLVGAK
ncbi:acyltransferase [Muricauda sp. 334s03]|uniref:Acyltransferase n=1 Tax=Flagellimonas yonaguniensis TaxID=3031325 RepID=A0ABT5Y301_9FLAO|nr:acyltransferase [[Muricauda] yonaguniensis]MDF0717417.1 acyltransferase [[Muricauda] yonaguniensis]